MVTYDYIWPETTNTVSHQEEFHDHHFPALIKVCVKPGFDDEQIVKSGYQDPRYFRGMSRFNSSVFLWTGHFEEKESDFTGKGNVLFTGIIPINYLFE